VAEMRFLGWLKTQILVSDFTPKNEIALFEPLLEMGLRVSTHAHMKNLHLSGAGEEVLSFLHKCIEPQLISHDWF
jgi:hypothetical protein